MIKNFVSIDAENRKSKKKRGWEGWLVFFNGSFVISKISSPRTVIRLLF